MFKRGDIVKCLMPSMVQTRDVKAETIAGQLYIVDVYGHDHVDSSNDLALCAMPINDYGYNKKFWFKSAHFEYCLTSNKFNKELKDILK